VLAAAAAAFRHYDIPGAEVSFGVGAAAIVGGISGLLLHYHRERRRQAVEDAFPEPRIHRRTVCSIETALVDRLVRALSLLKQRAEEKNWEPEWAEFDEHYRAAEDGYKRNSLTLAFAEYCRAMLPLTRAFNRQRHKEESFQPVWDRTP
jgi:hypothetical protein